MSTEFEPKNLLEVALKKAAIDAAARPTFLRELLESKVLIVPAGEKPRIIGGVIPADTKISIGTIQIGDRTCVPFFTSEARIPARTEYLVLDARALFEMTRGSYLVMNPGAAYGKEFFPDEIGRLLDGKTFEPQERYVAQKATQVMIGQPSDYPHELVAALSRLYSDRPAVKRAWIAFYHNPERDTEGGLLIGLDVPAESDMERISGESGIVIESIPKRHKFVDLIRYEKSGVTEFFTSQKPFYARSALKNLWQRISG